MSDANKCALCGGRISKERQISAATRGGDVRTESGMHKAKYCSTECRIETNWRKQADQRAQQRAEERSARAGKVKRLVKKKQIAAKAERSKKQAITKAN